MAKFTKKGFSAKKKSAKIQYLGNKTSYVLVGPLILIRKCIFYLLFHTFNVYNTCNICKWLNLIKKGFFTKKSANIHFRLMSGWRWMISHFN